MKEASSHKLVKLGGHYLNSRQFFLFSSVDTYTSHTISQQTTLTLPSCDTLRHTDNTTTSLIAFNPSYTYTYLLNPILTSFFTSFFLRVSINMMRASQALAIIFSVAVLSSLHVSVVLCAAPSSAIAEKCSSEFSRVGVCLSYATGKADTPSKECCATVKDIREKNAVCLCFVIQQVHDGSAAFKQMGLQEAKLLQLPTACSLADADISNCPKLLNLSPTSPDYGIFNSTKATPATPANASPATGSTTPPTSKDGSTGFGFVHKPLLALIAITLAMGFSLI